MDPNAIFESERPGYLSFRKGIESKAAIKNLLEADPSLQTIVLAHEEILKAWWAVARDDFAQLRDDKKCPTFGMSC